MAPLHCTRVSMNTVPWSKRHFLMFARCSDPFSFCAHRSHTIDVSCKLVSVSPFGRCALTKTFNHVPLPNGQPWGQKNVIAVLCKANCRFTRPCLET